jgi:serine protease Do
MRGLAVRGTLLLFALGAVIAPAAVAAPDSPPDPTGYLLAPKVFRAAADRVRPSLVTIESFGGVAKGGGKAAKGGRTPVQGISKPGEGPTTGLVVSPDGYILTSTYNFIRNPPVITVVLHDGSQHVAKPLGRDETRGIVLLKAELPEGVALSVPAFVRPDEVAVGQWAISVGVGYGGEEPALSAGVVSAKHRIFGKAIQTDANTSPANYGGPLIDIEGRVIGLCAPLSPQGGVGVGVQWYDSGIGFAVPVAGNEALIERLKAGEVVRPGRMGVMPKPGVASASTTGGGVEVAAVQPNTPAAKAGMQPGDIIVALDGQIILDMMQLRSVIGRYVAGDKVLVRVERGDDGFEVEMVLDAGEDAAARPQPPVRVERPKDE